MEGDEMKDIDNMYNGIVYDKTQGSIVYVWEKDDYYYRVSCCKEGAPVFIVPAMITPHKYKVNEYFEFLDVRNNVISAAEEHFNKKELSADGGKDA
jgi:hypothetical protein